MPEPAHEPTPSNPIRRAIEEGSRRLPGRVRQLPDFAVKTAVIGVGKLVEGTAKAREEYDELRRNGVAPTLDRLRREGLGLFRPGVPEGRPSHTPEATATARQSPLPTSTEQPPAPPRPAGERPAEESPGAAEPARTAEDIRTAEAPRTPDTTRPADTARPAEAADVAASTASPTHSELPLPDYDQLTLGSIRARLRNLSIADLGTLLAYERAHQNRSNIVTMYENRILKLQKEQGT